MGFELNYDCLEVQLIDNHAVLCTLHLRYMGLIEAAVSSCKG